MKRRELLTAGLAVGVSTAFVWSSASGGEEGSASVLKAEYFARDPDMSSPRLSPDGRLLAWVSGNKVNIYNLASGSTKILPGGKQRLDTVEWVTTKYLIVFFKNDQTEGRKYVTEVKFNPLVLDQEGKFLRNLFESDGAVMRPIIRFVDGAPSRVISFSGNNTFITDIETGKLTIGARLMRGDSFFFDSNGNERLAVDLLDGKLSYGVSKATLRYRVKAGASAQTLSLPEQDDIYYTNFYYSEYDNAAYWSQFDYNTGTASIFKYDLATAEKTLFHQSTIRETLIVQDKTGRVLGIRTLSDRVQTEWTDTYRQKLIAAIQKIYPTATVDIVDMTEDGHHAVIFISAPESPDSYYYYDTTTKELAQIGCNFTELEGQPLGEMTFVTYKARDGLDIPAYITKRRDLPPGAPLIVLPHGGPASRDVYGFDYMAQFLASRNYVVLQPQYRGSSGFGDAFERAGNKHIDMMVTDLEDGVRFLAASGTIDTAKVAIFGWSWGGYLAQASLAFTPDTYVCGISGAGVSDLFMALDKSNDSYRGGYSKDYWSSVIGGVLEDRQKIHAISPIEHVSAIKAPLLLIHGNLDRVVNIGQSERMTEAMQKADKNVTYMPMPFMFHGPQTEKQRLLVLQAVDAFIAKAFA